MEGLAKYLRTPTLYRGGPTSEITELRLQTAKMLNKPLEQVCGLTRGWSKNDIRDRHRLVQDFINPPALWWKLYKEKPIKRYARQEIKEDVCGLGKGRRGKKEDQCQLF